MTLSALSLMLLAGDWVVVPRNAGGSLCCGGHLWRCVLLRREGSLTHGNDDGENQVFPIQVSLSSLIIISVVSFYSYSVI